MNPVWVFVRGLIKGGQKYDYFRYTLKRASK